MSSGSSNLEDQVRSNLGFRDSKACLHGHVKEAGKECEGERERNKERDRDAERVAFQARLQAFLRPSCASRLRVL